MAWQQSPSVPSKAMADLVEKIIKSPNPCELGLAVHVRDTLLANPTLWPSQTGTIKYSDFSSKLPPLVQLDQAYAKGYGDYVFTFGEEGSSGAEAADGIPTTILYFAKDKSDEERNTPFKTWYTKRDWTFPEVVSGVEVQKVTDPITQIVTYYPKFFGLSEYVGPCIFKIEQFLSEVPWNANTFQSTAPQPQEIDAWIIAGTQRLHIQRSRCLHPELKFLNPSFLDTEIYFRTGVIPSLNGGIFQYIFPATQPAGRIAYVQADEQNPVQGQYLRERITVFPPRISQTIQR